MFFALTRCRSVLIDHQRKWKSTSFSNQYTFRPRRGASVPADGGEKCVVRFSMWEPNGLEKKAPGEYSWRGEDKNASPPEHDKIARNGIDSSSKLQKISFTQITLLDKSSVDQSGDSCAKQRIFNGFYGASYTISGLRPSFG